MQLREHVCLMAEYNQWMNEKLYAAAARLSAEELEKDRGAFFGSIIATLNHIAVADTIWLKRFAPLLQTHKELDFVSELNQPSTLNTILFSNISELKVRRATLDTTLSALAESITDAELSLVLDYKSTKGIPASKIFFSVLMHVFNHQTHHRGQVTTMLSQTGIDIGVTDLVAIIPNI